MSDKRRRIKRKYFIRRCIFALIVLSIIYLVYYIIFNIFLVDDNDIDNNSNNPSTSYKIDFEITNNSEEDSDIINTKFMDGMSLSDFESILNLNPNKVKSDSVYNFINYNFENKLHYYELEDYYKQLNNSDIVFLYEIGKSVDNRTIYGIEIGHGNDVLFLDANIHSAEVGSTLMLLKYMSELVNEYENNNDEIVNYLNNIKIAIIPCINPDGYEVYNFGIDSLNNKDLWLYQNKDSLNIDNIKSNANGVDINRNFPTQNEGLYYKDYKLISNTSIEKTTKSGKYFNGYVGGSEPETRAVMYFMLKHYKNTYAYINLHSQGRVIYAGKPNLSSEFNDLTVSFANKISSINNYKVHGLSSEEVGEGNDGSATDFMAELANGFMFSKETGRLSTDRYKNNSCKLEYKYPVITMETMKTWTRIPSYFKDEYENFGIREVLYELLDKNF